jgi:hypothetical protein
MDKNVDKVIRTNIRGTWCAEGHRRRSGGDHVYGEDRRGDHENGKSWKLLEG